MRINKKNILSTLCFFGIFLNVQIANAEYIAKFPLEGLNKAAIFEDYPSLYSDWYNIGSPKNCTTWSPTVDTVKQGNNFTQSSTCDQTQERTVQARQKDKNSTSIVNKGPQTKENQTIKVNSTQNAVGTKIPVKVCVPYGTTWGQGFWVSDSSGSVSIVYYGPSAEVSATEAASAYGLPSGTISYIIKDYKYTRGSIHHTSSGSSYYQVCRE